MTVDNGLRRRFRKGMGIRVLRIVGRKFRALG